VLINRGFSELSDCLCVIFAKGVFALNGFMDSSSGSKGAGGPGARPLIFGKVKKLKYLSFANSEGGPKRLKSDSCEAQSCFPGCRIIETTANGSDLFEAISHQLVAGTYNIQVSAVCCSGFFQLRQLRPVVRSLSTDATKDSGPGVYL